MTQLSKQRGNTINLVPTATRGSLKEPHLNPTGLLIIRHSSASELTPHWDRLADNYFQRRAFLLHVERYNPCKQRYYELYIDNDLAAGAVVYTLSIDLFTFMHIPSPVKMHVIGLPVSVSVPGLIGSPSAVKDLLEYIFQQERGIILGMNTTPDLKPESVVQMDMLPTVVMSRGFANWNEYIDTLRSSYRRRLKRIIGHFKNIENHESDCSGFDQALYRLYLQIHVRTKVKLERLSFEFFRNLPPEFRLTTYAHKGRVVAWYISLREEETLYFFFGGLDYSLNLTLNAYFNNLTGIVKEAIRRQCNRIDFGQTAEIPKMRMGGQLVEKKMFIYHRNWLIKKLFYYCRGVLGYNRKIPVANVFKSRGGG